MLFQKICVHLRLSASKKQSVGWLENIFIQIIMLMPIQKKLPCANTQGS
jgi:hypothetical protein